MNMNKFRKNLLIGVTVLGLGSGAFIANAQTSAGQQGNPERAASGGHKAHDGMKSPERMKEKIAKRQAELHGKLQLNASQEAAWKEFAAAMTPTGFGKRPDRSEWQNLSALERMEKHLALMKEREARMAERLAATKAFYATLTPEQQKIFNESFMNGRRHRKG
jgi:protein CpxP